MKKIMTIFLICVPLVSFADQTQEIRLQMLDSEIERLTYQRDSKYEELLKCEKSTKGFKIAGITTLVATGVGVYGNIKLSQKLNGKTSGGRGTKNFPTDTRSDEQKLSDECQEFANDPDVLAEAKAAGLC